MQSTPCLSEGDIDVSHPGSQPKQPNAETNNKTSVVMDLWLGDGSPGLPVLL